MTSLNRANYFAKHENSQNHERSLRATAGKSEFRSFILKIPKTRNLTAYLAPRLTALRKSYRLCARCEKKIPRGTKCAFKAKGLKLFLEIFIRLLYCYCSMVFFFLLGQARRWRHFTAWFRESSPWPAHPCSTQAPSRSPVTQRAIG